MSALTQSIRFIRSPKGMRIAVAETGMGYPILQPAHWITAIEGELTSLVWSGWIQHLSKRGHLIRYDGRGCGLSDRDVGGVSLHTHVADLEAVADGLNVERFALIGLSQGGATAMTYAARHPERVSHLILVGAYSRGAYTRNPTPQTRDAANAMVKLVELGWGQENPAFRQLMTTQLFPAATLEQMQSFNELQRQSATSERAALILAALAEIDATEYLPNIQCPTLVMHCHGDARVPFAEGRFIAASIPGARLEPLESKNHVPLVGEPAYEQMLRLTDDFLPRAQQGADTVHAFDSLTPREHGVLELIARGLDNAQIAAHLALSEKTVRNNITQIFDKLAVENRAQAIVRAREAGLGRGDR
jgi:pimeloyl-ACP methyl ester carboxylesterase/DNA-binding CsgD family transcriptional regulator